VIAVARKGEASISQVAPDFEISESVKSAGVFV
jgi:hypothetical protein